MGWDVRWRPEREGRRVLSSWVVVFWCWDDEAAKLRKGETPVDGIASSACVRPLTRLILYDIVSHHIIYHIR